MTDNDPTTARPVGKLNAWSLVRYLLGDRETIRQCAGSRKLLPIGLLFALSAGFAREYDGEDLLSEPWHLLIPAAVSLASSAALYWIALGVPLPSAAAENTDTRLGFPSFLTLFWLTAPLAWLYALPVERWFGPAEAVRCNLILLGVVSTWRVLLMIRVLSVLGRFSVLQAAAVVLFFADLVASAVFWLTPLPIISVMGGLRLSESEELIAAVTLSVRALGVLTLPVWAIAYGVVLFKLRRLRVRGAATPDAIHGGAGRPLGGSWLAVAAASLLIWAPILPATQTEQRNRRHAEELLLNHQLTEAITFLSQRTPQDFPPHWDPPPRFAYGQRRPPIWDVLLAVWDADAPDWVRLAFEEKLTSQAGAYPYGPAAVELEEMDAEALSRYAAVLERLPDGDKLARSHAVRIEWWLQPPPGEAGRVRPETVTPEDPRYAPLKRIYDLGQSPSEESRGANEL